jgi:hypothetical protein
MQCSSCERKIPDGLVVCPHCTGPQAPFYQNPRILVALGLLVMLVIVILALQEKVVIY